MPTREIDNVCFNGAACDAFTCGYVTAALWSSTDDHDKPLDDSYAWEDIARETLQRMIVDCQQFQAENAAFIASNPLRAGIDFWLTRNGHGAGFWDGDWPEPDAELLTDNAHRFGEVNLYVGDDGQIYA